MATASARRQAIDKRSRQRRAPTSNLAIGHPKIMCFGTTVYLLLLVIALAGNFAFPATAIGFETLSFRAATIPFAAVATVVLVGFNTPRPGALRGLGAICGPFSLLVFWIATSGLWSQSLARLAPALIDLSFLLTLVTLFWLTATRLTSAQINIVWAFFVIIAGLYLVAALATGPEVTGRYSAFGTGPNVFVRVMALGALGTLFLATKGKLWFLVLTPALLLGAGLSGSRGGTLALAIVLVIAALPIAKRLGNKGRAALVLISTFSIVAAAVIAGQRASELTQLSARYTGAGTGTADGDSYRGQIFSSAWRIFLDRPFVGAGLDAYWAESGNRLGLQHAHNLVLAVASDSGIIGLIILGILFIQIIRHCRPKPDTTTLFAFLGGAVILLSSLVSGTYYDTRLAWMFFGLAVINHSREKLPNAPDEAPSARRPHPRG